jgi:hypothetical protein
MKLKLSDTQLRILAPVFQFAIVFSSVNILFCIATALGLETIGTAFVLAFLLGFLTADVVSMGRFFRDHRKRMQALEENQRRWEQLPRRIEGDEWRDADP